MNSNTVAVVLFGRAGCFLSQHDAQTSPWAFPSQPTASCGALPRSKCAQPVPGDTGERSPEGILTSPVEPRRVEKLSISTLTLENEKRTNMELTNEITS